VRSEMKRQSKELISAILTVGSFIGMILAFIVAGGSWSVTAAVVVLVLVVVLVASMVALVSFSKTGWKVVGSKNEWDAAIAISPSKTAF
jgi:membrane protein YdbS with pleckstrin-like domain